VTAIALNTKINGAGNQNFTCAYDVIFPLIATAISATYALASHPILKAWSDSGLSNITAGTGDAKMFWSTSPTYDAGTAVPGSALRAIATHSASSGSNWAANANQTGGTGDPSAGLGRCLRGNTDYLPLLPSSQNFLGDNNTGLVNRCLFNLAMAVHSATSTTAGVLQAYLAVHYAFVDQDPTCSVRGNTNQSGEPSATGITSLNHTHMHSIFGDDAALAAAGGDRVIRHADTAASNSLPYMTLPTSGFKYSDKAVATAS